MKSIPILAVGYNRPISLDRLLHSLQNAVYRDQVKLYISIDGNGNAETVRIAEQFKWPFGEKELIIHPSNLGLKRHIMQSVSLVEQHEAIIVLEDDLYVSPFFHEYVSQATAFYAGLPQIGGISLYSHGYNETAQFPFQPIHDESDVFFLQIASSLGQCWTRQQWSDFISWYEEPDSMTDASFQALPPNVKLWPDSSWKKIFIQYMIARNKYFVYPRISLTTNFSDAGQHMSRHEQFLQQPLLFASKGFSFKKIEDSVAVYDSYCEILPDRLTILCPHLQNHPFDTDLYGMKDPVSSKQPYMLTSGKCKTAIMQFGRELKPMETNVIGQIAGKVFSLSPTKAVKKTSYFKKLMKCSSPREIKYHFNRRFYHKRWSRLILLFGNFLFHPRVFPLIKKFR